MEFDINNESPYNSEIYVKILHLKFKNVSSNLRSVHISKYDLYIFRPILNSLLIEILKFDLTLN